MELVPNNIFFPFKDFRQSRQLPVDVGAVARRQANGETFPQDYPILRVPLILPEGIFGSLDVIPEISGHFVARNAGAALLLPMGNVRLNIVTDAKTGNHTIAEAPVTFQTSFGVANVDEFYALSRYRLELMLGRQLFAYDLAGDDDPETVEDALRTQSICEVESIEPSDVRLAGWSNFVRPLVPGRLNSLARIRARLIEESMNSA